MPAASVHQHARNHAATSPQRLPHKEYTLTAAGIISAIIVGHHRRPSSSAIIVGLIVGHRRRRPGQTRPARQTKHPRLAHHRRGHWRRAPGHRRGPWRGFGRHTRRRLDRNPDPGRSRRSRGRLGGGLLKPPNQNQRPLTKVIPTSRAAFSHPEEAAHLLPPSNRPVWMREESVGQGPDRWRVSLETKHDRDSGPHTTSGDSMDLWISTSLGRIDSALSPLAD